ncbi:MAG: hypothetical protein RIC56_23200 [Pseudomonadales bacterium]
MQSTATIHSTNCSSYVVTLNDASPTEAWRCSSLQQAYDLLRRNRVRHAVLAQRIPFDEVLGTHMQDDVSYMPVVIPPA